MIDEMNAFQRRNVNAKGPRGTLQAFKDRGHEYHAHPRFK